MLRTFENHEIRDEIELSGKLWNLTLLEEEYKSKELKAMVPGCVESIPGLENYRGWVSFETSFEAEGNVRLEFKGVSHYAKVFIDEIEVADHYGSYTPFDVCIRDLASGWHSLKVMVDNEFREEYALDMPNDYMSYGGISRGVVLEKLPDVYIKYAHFTPICEKDGTWSGRAEIVCHNLLNSEFKGTLKLNIADQEVCCEEYNFTSGENKICIHNLKFSNVSPWSMEVPTLYMMKVLLMHNEKMIDDWMDRIGFRTIEVYGRQVLLNGRPIRIKGFCRHEDHPHYGCALPVEAISYDLQLIKDMGGNSIRTSHYPNDELFLDLCDEMGILVWEENHARGIISEKMENPYFEPQCEQVIREMITCHYNHPSIYIWGILNECGSDTEYGRSCYKAQYELIRSLDSSRPTSSASCRFQIDICQDLPDICSWNIYPYWYEQKTAANMAHELQEWVETNGGQGKPFLITEIGAGGIYGFRDPAHDIWSEELQAEIIRKQLDEIFALHDCIGLYIWQFCDVRVSRLEWGLVRPRSRNNKGMVDEYRRPKMAYYDVKKIFGELSNYLD
ncbi:MAG: glycoside hydrolase family 2 TIM barrel-domain containing protein [Lachnospiraceae bacterium]